MAMSAMSLPAQTPAPGTDMTLDAATRAAVVDGLLAELDRFYVFPDVAARMIQAIERRRSAYDVIGSAQQLAEVLTTHLREVSQDRHLEVVYSAEVLPPNALPPPLGGPPPEMLERMRAVVAASNFGFEKVERLAGNIGYLDLRAFAPPALMGDTAAAAMNVLAGADALIIDLRQNRGGSADAVALIASYFFGPQAVRLNEIYDRPSNQTRQFWTLPYVPGARFAGRDVYVLTSRRTFSAAEDFAYALKNLERATIVGEVTGGGAHAGGPRRIHDHFFVFVPSSRTTSPITGADWEGVGVVPDVAVPAARALAAAHLRALETRAPTVDDPRMRAEIAAAIERLREELK